MKNANKISLVAFTAAMMWSHFASATLLSDTATNTTAAPSTLNSSFSVAAGCTAPTGFLHNTYFIDPVHGKASNPGTAAAPWDTLQNVLAQKKAILKGGDVLNLMSGNHGAVSVLNMVNSDFITVKAAPGQIPVLSRLTISGAQNWIFQGLKIEGIKTGHLITVGTSFTSVISKNIILNGNTLLSQDDVTAWSKADWVSNASGGISIDGRPDMVDADSPVINDVEQSHHTTNCIAVTNNAISHVKGAVGFNADHSLFQGNSIDDYADDAVDFGGNYLTLSYNRITNVNDIADYNHDDGFQGFLPGGSGYNASTFSNDVIDHNTIIRQTTPNLPFAGSMQGIDNFDGGGYRDWYHLKVTNNLVITNTWNAITFGGIHDSLIANNTVLGDGVKTSQLNAGSGLAPVTAPGNASWVEITDYNHFSQKSSNVTVTNNVGVSIQSAGATDPTIVVSNNLALAEMSLFANGKAEWYSKPGTYGTGNMIDPTFDNYFSSVTSIATPNGPMTVYNTSLKTGSPYQVMGVNGAAPTLPYSGTLTLTANARMDGAPALQVLIDGKAVGIDPIDANVHIGQTASYKISFTSPSKPQKIDVVLDGYTSTEQKYVSTNLFNLFLTENKSPRVDLVRQTTGKVVKGNISLTSSGAEFFTNGSILEFDVSKL